jgi:DAK2 domain fusion protein YloV
MVLEVKRQVCDGHLLKSLIAAGLSWLEQNHDTVNKLNVFPVPDGDTGTNMLLTMKKAYTAIESSEDQDVYAVMAKVAIGALLGARGNSGVILSQIFSGFSQELQGSEVLDLALFNRACQRGVKAAYAAVNAPVEGTILTVAREAAEKLEAHARINDGDLVAGFEALIQGGRAALAKTPELLPILKKAGVVDSGGQGLIFILEGMLRLLHGEPTDTVPETAAKKDDTERWQDALVPEDEEGYGYDVQFLLHGEGLDVARVRADIEAMGWSTLVVGDSQLIKVHVHVHDPGVPLSYAIKAGAYIDDIVVENMHQQYQDYVERREGETNAIEIRQVAGIAVVAVVNGSGLRQLMMDELGVAAVISGGQTMNPSAEDFVSAIEQLQNEEIILLPNNKNIILAAEQAARLSKDKRVRVIPTRTIPQAVAALVAYISLKDTETLDEVEAGMLEAAKEVVTCEVTTAIRDADLNGIKVQDGQFIGMINGELKIAAPDLEEAVIEVVTKAGAADYELVTLYYGEQVSVTDKDALLVWLAERFPAQEFTSVYGGQPLYPYIISLE